MKTKFVKTNMKHYCIKDKKRHTSSELVNKCGGCIINRCTTAVAIKHLKDIGLI